MLDFEIPIGLYRISFIAEKQVNWWRSPASIWRSLLGQKLVSIDCDDPQSNQCGKGTHCAFHGIFKTGYLPHKMGYAASSPLALRPVRSHSEQAIVLDFCLFGTANRFLIPVIESLQGIGCSGIGPRNARVQLDFVSVEQFCWKQTCFQTIFDSHKEFSPMEPGVPEAPAQPKTATVELQTPLQIVTRKPKKRKISAEHFTIEMFLHKIDSRINSLACHYGVKVAPSKNQILPTSFLDSHLIDFEAKPSYSIPRTTYIDLSGIVGTFSFDTSELQSTWPKLWVAQWTHIGKKVTYGLGAYRIMAEQ